MERGFLSAKILFKDAADIYDGLLVVFPHKLSLNSCGLDHQPQVGNPLLDALYMFTYIFLETEYQTEFDVKAHRVQNPPSSPTPVGDCIRVNGRWGNHRASKPVITPALNHGFYEEFMYPFVPQAHGGRIYKSKGGKST